MNSAANNSAPIGIFDSGIGGISIARCIEQLLPNEELIYFADSKFAPYGDLSVEEIITRVNTVADLLITRGVKAIVLACNTATVNAIDQLRSRVDIPIIGVEPAIKPAAMQSQSNNVGILVTRATASNRRFLNLVESHKGNAQVHIQPCPGLVQLIEQGKHQTAACKELLTRFISPLIEKRIDTLVLGCTHYPLVAEKIQQIAGNNIQLLETAIPVTEELKRQLQVRKLTASVSENKPHIIISSADINNLQKVISQFWLSDLAFTTL